MQEYRIGGERVPSALPTHLVSPLAPSYVVKSLAHALACWWAFQLPHSQLMLECPCWLAGLVSQKRKKGNGVLTPWKQGQATGQDILESQVSRVGTFRRSRTQAPDGHIPLVPRNSVEGGSSPGVPFNTGAGARPSCLILKAVLSMLTTL